MGYIKHKYYILYVNITSTHPNTTQFAAIHICIFLTINGPTFGKNSMKMSQICYNICHTMLYVLDKHMIYNTNV